MAAFFILTPKFRFCGTYLFTDTYKAPLGGKGGK